AWRRECIRPRGLTIAVAPAQVLNTPDGARSRAGTASQPRRAPFRKAHPQADTRSACALRAPGAAEADDRPFSPTARSQVSLAEVAEAADGVHAPISYSRSA